MKPKFGLVNQNFLSLFFLSINLVLLQYMAVHPFFTLDKKFKLIDSPGVRDIGIEHLLAKDILHGFSEIENLASSCAYPKCSHQEDDGCAVMEALNNDEIAQSRYNNFMTIVQSSNYGE